VANEIVGRLLFLPTLTTYSLWHVGHNVAHHGFANLKGRDQVWVPLSPQEYAALPRWRRAIERLYRSIWGFGLYYFIELWWRKLFFPSRRHVGAQRKIFWVDSLTTLAMALAYIVLLIVAAMITDQRWWVLLLCGAVMPFALWNHLMGMVIFVHHTGPEMRWFNKRSEWLRMRGVAELTRDVRLPWRIDKLLHGIMLHRAHHFDPRIPNYRLAQATRRLFADGLSSARSTVAGWRFLRELTRRCALYDYEARRWLGFPDKASPAGA
jgi:omega-6 fatty acid desaturase (delta-12 desaturase)